MRNAIISILFGLSALTSPAILFADDNTVVVELYTSQGCSSCPPADKLLSELAGRENVVALALHVDYWDYIGWKDEFADPSHARRQRAYAQKSGRQMIYTPQMIIGGAINVEGARPMKIIEGIQNARANNLKANLRLARRGEQLRIRANRARIEGEVEVHLVRFTPQQSVKILRGENRGRTLTYSHVVTSWTTLQNWDGKSPLNLREKITGTQGVAVVLQYPGFGAIVSAAKLDG